MVKLTVNISLEDLEFYKAADQFIRRNLGQHENSCKCTKLV